VEELTNSDFSRIYAIFLAQSIHEIVDEMDGSAVVFAWSALVQSVDATLEWERIPLRILLTL